MSRRRFIATASAVGTASAALGPALVAAQAPKAATKETLRAVAFFAAAMFTQTFDNVMLPVKSHVLGTPNREGEVGY